MNTRVLSKNELVDLVLTLSPGFVVGMLFSGDRISCCDEAVAVEESGKIVSLATIAPEGEQHSGQPTIVALYTLPEFRKKGFGKTALLKAIERCKDRKFKSVRIDAMSVYVIRIINSLNAYERAYLDVYDYGGIMDLVP